MGRAFEFRKARKMKRWSAMSKAFTRIGKDIVMAVKEGGADPDSNSRLRAVIQNGKAVNMPKDNIERAIKRASDKSQGDYKEVLFEGYAPMFDHTCNFRINAEGLEVDEIELEFIDFGAEEVFKDDDGILIYAPFESFGAIQSALEERNIEILSSGFERIPQVTKPLNEAQVADVEKLLEKLEEDDDVQFVYHTMQE